MVPLINIICIIAWGGSCFRHKCYLTVKEPRKKKKTPPKKQARKKIHNTNSRYGRPRPFAFSPLLQPSLTAKRSTRAGGTLIHEAHGFFPSAASAGKQRNPCHAHTPSLPGAPIHTPARSKPTPLCCQTRKNVNWPGPVTLLFRPCPTLF